MKKRGKDYGEGMRRMFKDLLDDRRIVYPRYKETRTAHDKPKSSQLRHPIEWYLDGHLVNRPVYGIYALGVFAEHLLYRVKFGRGRNARALNPVMEFYAETRRVMQSLLTSCSVDKRVPKEVLHRMRKRVTELLDGARKAYDAVTKMKRDQRCPVCNGHALSAYDIELLEAILLKCSERGEIPIDSKLYRETPLG